MTKKMHKGSGIMCNEIDIFKDQYNKEIALIKANGNNKAALRKRFEQYQIHDRELLDHIHRRSMQQAGRMAALDYMMEKIG